MKVLVTINDAPYGSERAYNGLRIAGSLARREDCEVRVFLVGDGAACAKGAQKVPQGYYNIQTLVASVTRHGGKVGVCGTCMDARGIAEAELTEGTHRSSLEEWATWTVEADKTLVF
jgi:uncharacterized protein involved in oxidation of intracellular sulfur